MDILAFLIERRPRGSGKGKAASKLLRKVKDAGAEWSDPKPLQLIPRIINRHGGIYNDSRAGLERVYQIVDGEIEFTLSSESVNREWLLKVSFDGAGGYRFKSLEGSLRAFALHCELSEGENIELIDEAERTGYMDAQDAMIERLDQ